MPTRLLTFGALFAVATGAFAQELPPSGLFSPGQSIRLDAKLDAVAMGDMNGDGRLDVVAVGEGTVAVLLQTSSGALEPAYQLGGPGPTPSVALAHLDGDGRLDVVLSWNNELWVFRGTASGTLQRDGPIYLLPVPGPVLLRTGDFNGDGRTDLVGIPMSPGRQVVVCLQSPSGQLSAPKVYLFDHFGRDLGVADVTGDGRDDIVVTGRFDHAFWVMAQDGAGGFATPVPYDLGPGYTVKDLAVAEVTGDVHRDVVVTYEPGTGSGLAIFAGKAGGGFDPPADFPCTATQPCEGGQEIVEAGDLNGDGRADLVTIGKFGFEMRTYLQTADGGLGAGRGDRLGMIEQAGPQAAAIGDVNGDGLADVVVADHNLRSVVVFYRTPCRDLVQDGSFEAVGPNPFWLQYSTHFGTPLCRLDVCGNGGGTAAPRSGATWAWFGGVKGEGEVGALAQDLTLATLAAGESPRLKFHLWNGFSSGNGIDFLRASIDATPVFSTLAGNPSFASGYSAVTVDLRPFSDGGTHRLTFDAYTTGSAVTNFSVDDVSVEACQASTSLDMADTMIAEGDSGTTTAFFTVSLAAPSADVVTVLWSTADGTAQAGRDYVPATGTLSFFPGETVATITVPVLGDRLLEGNEQFFVNLTGPRLAFVRRGRAVATIVDDDSAGIAIDDIGVTAPSHGTAPATFTVTLAPPNPNATVSVHYATADGTGVAGLDYDAASGDVSFPPGVSTAPVSIDVKASPDGREKTFFVNLTGASAGPIAHASGTATINAPGFHSVSPCRLFDSRLPLNRPALVSNRTRTLSTKAICNLPSTARAVFVNVTVTGATAPGHLRFFSQGAALPTVSTINYGAGETRANNAMVRLDPDGQLAVYCGQGSGTVHLILDVNGYFTSP